MSVPDRGYVNLIGHLRQTRPSLPFETLQAAISHYLVHLPPTHATPTPLTATIIGSPLWLPLSLTNSLGLASAFRYALLAKYTKLKDESRGLFSPSLDRSLSTWINSVLSGQQNGDAVLRLAITGSILLGLEDLKSVSIPRLRRKVQEETVIAAAECLDAERLENDRWTKEFEPRAEAHRVLIGTLLASQYFPLIPADIVSVMRLPELAEVCLATITSSFQDGCFMKKLALAISMDEAGQLNIAPASSFAANLKSLTSSDGFQWIGPICKLLCQVISTGATRSSWDQRKATWTIMGKAMTVLDKITSNVESDWNYSDMANMKDDDLVAIHSRETTTELWTVLKTLLFSVVMVSQTILSTVVFDSAGLAHPDVLTDAEFAMNVLWMLSHLSFIISKFGGVVVTGQSHRADGFKELKKVFHTALDVLSADKGQSEAFVQRLSETTGLVYEPERQPLCYHAWKAYALGCVEQLIPVINEQCTENYVLPMCQPHLSDPSNRETFESAHSVVLAIFAAHAAKTTGGRVVSRKGKAVERFEGSLAKRLVPGYVKSLIENTKEGKLSTAQLRLAYASLVRSATVTGRNEGTHDVADEALEWLCVETLLDAIHECAHEPDNGVDSITAERQRLSLTLISIVPNVDAILLPRVLGEVEALIEDEKDLKKRGVLVNALFEEILQRVGDREKEAAMQWWHEHARHWRLDGVNLEHTEDM
ncbi:hypothetical protein BD410DRAFT_858264 [Rickenella mellea]|uniref:Uncharacterized protein n=1 Tax=Rickenella mellea TaxID=50990 RepID=A0A4Y7Q6A3_9AGAM|nr:hypothetical protein BD410DRAFT_858264 [Rickenella mellea]